MVWNLFRFLFFGLEVVATSNREVVQKHVAVTLDPLITSKTNEGLIVKKGDQKVPKFPLYLSVLAILFAADAFAHQPNDRLLAMKMSERGKIWTRFMKEYGVYCRVTEDKFIRVDDIGVKVAYWLVACSGSRGEGYEIQFPEKLFRPTFRSCREEGCYWR